ncbi:MAG: GNAT family N-acetyltransferase [Hyphomicrobium sp.]
MQPEIRQIRDEDVESFYAAFSSVVFEHKYLAFLDPPPIEETRAFIRNNIEKGYPQLVAIADGDVVGWCDIIPPDRAVSAHVGILGIALMPDWRGNGLGERLMRAALGAADAFGYLRVELSVFSHNTRAYKLYCKLGFSDEGAKVRGILLDGVFYDEIMMARLKS